MLACIIVLSLAAHINFFLKDARPFLDHDWHYFTEGHLIPIVWLHAMLEAVVGFCFPFLDYNSFFLYKLANGFFLVPAIIFTYLSASFLYNRFAGLLASYFLITVPCILNVFHKSSVNLLTVSLFAVIVYFYIRSNCFRNLYFSLFFLITLYMFFLHHYSSLLYLSVLLPVYIAFSAYRLKKNQNIVRKIRSLCVFLFCLLLIDFLFNFARYKGYFDAGLYYFDYHFKVQADSFWVACLSFLKKCGHNLGNIYNYYFLYFSFYSFFSLIAIICYLYQIISMRLKKIYFSAAEFMETQFVVIVLGILMLLSTGICKASLFVAPLYVILAILNAGIIFKMYKNYGHRAIGRIAVFIFTFLVFVHGFFSLFYAHWLITEDARPMAYYSYNNDDFNISAYMNFIDNAGAKEVNFDIIAADEYSEGKTTLFKFYFVLRMKERINNDFLKANYVFVLHDLIDEEFVTDTKSLLAIEQAARAQILSRPEGVIEKDIALKHVLPYGFLEHRVFKYRDFKLLKQKYKESFTGTISDLMPKRDCLVFIYELK